MINSTQLVVKTDKKVIDWLESQGYANPHKLPDNYAFSVFIVDLPSKVIFGTNTTCMAALSGCSRITELTIPDGVTTIGASAF